VAVEAASVVAAKKVSVETAEAVTNLSESFNDKQELTQALNIFLDHYAKSANNLAAIGSSKTFSLNQNPGRGDLGAGLESLGAFFQACEWQPVEF
jgi:hypothetical protein